MVVSVVSTGAVHREVHRSPGLSRWALGSIGVPWPARPLRPTVGQPPGSDHWLL